MSACDRYGTRVMTVADWLEASGSMSELETVARVGGAAFARQQR